jgi:hypothetical protein
MKHFFFRLVFVDRRERITTIALKEYTVFGILSSSTNNEQNFIETTPKTPDIRSLIVLLFK